MLGLGRLRRRRPAALVARRRRVIVQRVLEMHDHDARLGLIRDAAPARCLSTPGSPDAHRAGSAATRRSAPARPGLCCLVYPRTGCVRLPPRSTRPRLRSTRRRKTGGGHSASSILSPKKTVNISRFSLAGDTNASAPCRDPKPANAQACRECSWDALLIGVRPPDGSGDPSISGDPSTKGRRRPAGSTGAAAGKVPIALYTNLPGGPRRGTIATARRNGIIRRSAPALSASRPWIRKEQPWARTTLPLDLR